MANSICSDECYHWRLTTDDKSNASIEQSRFAIVFVYTQFENEKMCKINLQTIKKKYLSTWLPTFQGLRNNHIDIDTTTVTNSKLYLNFYTYCVWLMTIFNVYYNIIIIQMFVDWFNCFRMYEELRASEKRSRKKFSLFCEECV